MPWPDPCLSPNARGHWGAKSRAVKAARAYACFVAKKAGVVVVPEGPVALAITFRPPDRRGRDMDNAIASCKAIFDGLADAMQVNDNRFRLSFVWGLPASPGRVDIVVGGGE
jgi:crossover junction endodeoxyribonuclease RusA